MQYTSNLSNLNGVESADLFNHTVETTGDSITDLLERIVKRSNPLLQSEG
jgi:hypothetical protein